MKVLSCCRFPSFRFCKERLVDRAYDWIEEIRYGFRRLISLSSESAGGGGDEAAVEVTDEDEDDGGLYVPDAAIDPDGTHPGEGFTVAAVGG